MKNCERCGKKLNYTYFEDKKDSLMDLYLNGLSVDLCRDCEKDLLKWLNFSHEKLSDEYMIVTREEP